MARSTILPLSAVLALLGGAALEPALGQTTTIEKTTTIKKLGDLTSQTTVTRETTVLGEPQENPLVIDEERTTGTQGAATGPAVPTGAPAHEDEVQTHDGVRYACTGIAHDSRDDPRWAEFPAKLVYSVNGGGYLSDVLTRIEDGQGNAVFTMRCNGPWLLVDLPPDSYRVIATAEDRQGQVHQKTKTMSVGASGQSETNIQFSEIPG